MTEEHAAELEGSDEETPKKARTKSALREYTEAIIIALLLALFIRTFIIQAFKIPTGSMEPTLLVGDYILVTKFSYGVKFMGRTVIELAGPRRGDIIVFRYPPEPSKDYIKRVIGVPGDTVSIKNKQVLVNGEPLKEPYAVHRQSYVMSQGASPRDNFGPRKVPKGHLFVMGDNRDNSHDSRFWGFVPFDLLRGKAFIIYWSWEGRSIFSLVTWPWKIPERLKVVGHLRLERLGHMIN